MKAELKALIDEKRQRAIIPEYNDTVSDREVLGMLLAEYFDYDGLAILEVAESGLEDANFHTESAQISDLIDKVRADFGMPAERS